MNPKDRQHILRRLGCTPVTASEYPGIRKAMEIIEEDAVLVPEGINHEEALKAATSYLNSIAFHGGEGLFRSMEGNIISNLLEAYRELANGSPLMSHYKEVAETLGKRLEAAETNLKALKEALEAHSKVIEDKNAIIKAQEEFIQRQHRDSTEKFNEIRDLKFKLAKSEETVNVQSNQIRRLERDVKDMQQRINNDWQVKNHLENTLRERDREIVELKAAAARKKWGRKR